VTVGFFIRQGNGFGLLNRHVLTGDRPRLVVAGSRLATCVGLSHDLPPRQLDNQALEHISHSNGTQ
jgi:hypothetical protein